MKAFLKAVYKAIPLKREFFSALKQVWKPRDSIYRHLHFTGVFTVHVDGSKRFKLRHYGFQLENEIFWSGLKDGWEKESIHLWVALCRDAGVVFDIGANTGVYALIAKTMNPKARVFAFEPVERVFAKLQENIALNGYDIEAVQKAVSDSDGTAVIYDTISEHVYSVTVNKNLNAPQTAVRETRIATITLDSFIAEHALQQVDLLKIDVETHEPEVLEGFATHLARFKPTLLIEILSHDVGVKVQALVAGLGYLYFNIDERGGVRQASEITRSDYYNYLLCNEATAKRLGLLGNV